MASKTITAFEERMAAAAERSAAALERLATSHEGLARRLQAAAAEALPFLRAGAEQGLRELMEREGFTVVDKPAGKAARKRR